MMYEIYLEPKGGLWRIRIVKIVCLFFTTSSVLHTRKVAATGEPLEEYAPLEFDTYTAASAHVSHVGIDRAYRQLQRAKGYVAYLHAEGGRAEGVADTSLEVQHAGS